MTLLENELSKMEYKCCYVKKLQTNKRNINNFKEKLENNIIQKSQQQLYRRCVSIKLDKCLRSRPSRSDLAKKNIMLSEGGTIVIDTIRESREIDTCTSQMGDENGKETINDSDGQQQQSGATHRSRPTRELDTAWADEAIKDVDNYSSDGYGNSSNNSINNNVKYDRRRGRDSMEIAVDRDISSDPTNPESNPHRQEQQRRLGRESRELDSSYVDNVNSTNNNRRRGRDSMELPGGYSGGGGGDDNNRYSNRSHGKGPSLDIGDLAMDTPVPDDLIDLIERPQLVRQTAVVKERLARKLRQRPSIEDTISRDIIFTRSEQYSFH